MKGGTRLRGEKYSYYFKYKDEFGKWRTKEKGGFDTKKAAESALRKAIVEFEESGQMIQNTNYTLEEYIDYWFKNVGELKLKYRSVESYAEVARNHIIPDLGFLKLDKLTPVLMQKFFTQKQKILSDSRINSIKNVLNNTLNLAVKQNIITQNPMKSIVLSSNVRTRKEIRALTLEDINLLESELIGTKYYTPFLLALYTGARRNEALGLTWDNVNFASNTISIKQQLQMQNKSLVLVEPKTRTSNRVLQMPQKLREALVEIKELQKQHRDYYGQHYLDEPDFVCCEEDGSPIPPTSITLKMNHLQRKLGVNFKFHDLRHTHAAMMLEANVNIKVLQERLGHSKIGTTLDVYGHVTKKLEDEAIKKFDNFF